MHVQFGLYFIIAVVKSRIVLQEVGQLFWKITSYRMYWSVLDISFPSEKEFLFFNWLNFDWLMIQRWSLIRCHRKKTWKSVSIKM